MSAHSEGVRHHIHATVLSEEVYEAVGGVEVAMKSRIWRMARGSREREILAFEKRGRVGAEERGSLKVRWWEKWERIREDQRESWRVRVAWFGWRV